MSVKCLKDTKSLFAIIIRVKKVYMEEADLKCSLCLDIFTAPVLMTNCGHNFCSKCLKANFEASAADSDADSDDENQSTCWSCPECRTTFYGQIEDLARNFFVERTIEKYQTSRMYLCGAHNLQKKLRKCFLVKVIHDTPFMITTKESEFLIST